MASLAPPNPLEVFGPTIMKCFFFLPSLCPVTCLALGWVYVREVSVHKRGPLSSKFTPEMAPSVTIYMYVGFLKADTHYYYVHSANWLQPCTGHLCSDVLPPALMESCFKRIFKLFPPKYRLWFHSIENLLKKTKKSYVRLFVWLHEPLLSCSPVTCLSSPWLCFHGRPSGLAVPSAVTISAFPWMILIPHSSGPSIWSTW